MATAVTRITATIGRTGNAAASQRLSTAATGRLSTAAAAGRLGTAVSGNTAAVEELGRLLLLGDRVLLLLATVGLGVSDFGYCIFAVLISVVSCMDLEQKFSARTWPLRKRSRRQCTKRSV